MSATVVVCQRSGIGYSAADVAKALFYFLPIDSNIAEPADNPMETPASGTVYSYEVWIKFRVDVAPSTQCNDFKIWTAGSLDTGNNITVNNTDIDTYVAPVNSQSAIGTRADITDYTSANKLSITGTLVNINDITDYIVFQLELASTSLAGSKSFTIYYSYEEM